MNGVSAWLCDNWRCIDIALSIAPTSDTVALRGREEHGRGTLARETRGHANPITWHTHPSHVHQCATPVTFTDIPAEAMASCCNTKFCNLRWLLICCLEKRMKNDPSNLQVKIKSRIYGPVANGGLRWALTSQAQWYFHIKNSLWMKKRAKAMVVR